MPNDSSNPNANPPPMEWDVPENQRAAARAFLQDIINDTTGNLRAAVKDRTTAHTEFANRGNIAIPDDVEVICLEPDIPSRKKLVVLILPENGEVFPSDTSVLQHWPTGWSPYSSARFKRNIETMGEVSGSIFGLRPVKFRYNDDVDPYGLPQFGLVAEEVEQANADLVLRDATGRPYGVRYDAINAMLLNEFLKQHADIKKQAETIAGQRKELDVLCAKIENLSRSEAESTQSELSSSCSS
jgi:hypothetical protein